MKREPIKLKKRGHDLAQQHKAVSPAQISKSQHKADIVCKERGSQKRGA